MNLDRILAGVGALILVFLILANAQAFNRILATVGSRFLEIVGVLQGREVRTGSTTIGRVVTGGGVR